MSSQKYLCPTTEHNLHRSSSGHICKLNCIRHVRIPPYHPQSNGQAGRFVDTFKRSLLKARREETTKEILQKFPLCYRTTPNNTVRNEMTLSEAQMGQKVHTTLDTLRPKEQKNARLCQNKDRPLSVSTPESVRSYRPGQANLTPGTTHKNKGRFIYSMQVRYQFWARHKKQLCPRYTSNITINNTSNIPLDLLVDTFELPATSPVEQTNINESNAEPWKNRPKWNRTILKHIKINPKRAYYS